MSAGRSGAGEAAVTPPGPGSGAGPGSRAGPAGGSGAGPSAAPAVLPASGFRGHGEAERPPQK